jgi:hypothetical protein
MSKETVCILKAPGVTETMAEAMAWNRLRGRPYRSELVGLPNASVQVWQVSFLVGAR